MFKRVRIISLFVIALGISFLGPNWHLTQANAQRCESIFTVDFKQYKAFTDPRLQKSLDIMMEGSLNVSRTKAVGRRFMAPKEVKDAEIAVIAEQNFIKAAVFILKNYKSLELNLETATQLNIMLTEGLVPPRDQGQVDYRRNGDFVHELDPAMGRQPLDFYSSWLNSAQAKQLYKNNPVEFAETVHNSIASLDSFPDGNGRLSRLFADLALIKAGYAPAYYTSMKDYFDRGNARSDVPRSTRKIYFREIVNDGMSAFH